MKQITTGDLLHAYGSFGLHLDYAVRLTVKLTDQIDFAILSDALRKTQQRFSFLSVRMGKNYEIPFQMKRAMDNDAAVFPEP